MGKTNGTPHTQGALYTGIWCGFTIGLVGVCVLALAVGCSRQEQERKPAQPAPPRVALVMKSLANEFFKTMELGARDYSADHTSEFALTSNGIKDEKDVSGQIALVEQMIAQRVDAIVLAPADSKALVPVCRKAMDAGIVIVNIDNKLDDEALKDKQISIPFVGPNNRAGAKLAGDFLGAQLKAGAAVAIVEGAPNAFNGIQRKLGFEDAMNAVGAKVASSQSGKWMMDDAEKVVTGMITQYPNLDAILCANDNMALGAIAALRAAGKLSQVKVVGYDNISAAQDLVREGHLLCTIDQHGDQIAVFGIQFALQLLRQEAPPADLETPVDLVTAETLKGAE